MKHNRVPSLLAVGLLQIGLIVLACVLGHALSREVLIIPKSVLRLPDVYVSTSDMWSLAGIFAAVYAMQILLTSLACRNHAFSSSRRFATEYLCYLFAYTTASLYSFLATTINYDPQLIAAIGLISTLLYLLVMIISGFMLGRQGIAGVLGQPIAAVLRRMFSVAGLLAGVYFLLPLALGMAFTMDRDIANRITQIRIWFNPVPESEWGLKNLYPELVFEQPVLARQAPGEPDSLYVLERVGRVYRVPFPQGGAKELVLDISEQLGEVEVENGALGLAFHPRYGESPQHRWAYLYYTDTRPERDQVNHLSRFDLSQPDPVARQASEFRLMSLEREGSGFHNGGSLEFGPDGYLYVGIGEGVHPRPPEARTSDAVLRAGVLRLDVDQRPGNRVPAPFVWGTLQGYHVPADNPFVANPAIRDEYWALGLRNPFRFTFDRETGDLWLGDVGSTVWEEINRIEKGKHYQFPVAEGHHPTGRSGWENLDIPERAPVYAYEHNAYDRAVVGGVVVRGDRYPSLQGKYVFADNYSAKIFVMPADQVRVDEVELIARASQYAQRGVSSVTQLASGEVLVTTLGAASEPSGEVLMLVRAEDADVVERPEPRKSLPADYDESAASASFAVNCARCHGVTGDGEGPDAAMLDVPLPDLTSPLYHAGRSDEEIQAVIEKGGTAVGMSPLMPPWGGFLEPREIEHLVLYIRSLPDKHHRH